MKKITFDLLREMREKVDCVLEEMFSHFRDVFLSALFGDTKSVVQKIASIKLAPGDILIVTIDISPLDLKAYKEIRDALHETFEGNKYIVVSKGVEFSVIKREIEKEADA